MFWLGVLFVIVWVFCLVLVCGACLWVLGYFRGLGLV